MGRIPQVLAIVQPSSEFAVTMNGKLRDYLHLEGSQVYLSEDHEILLSANRRQSGHLIELYNNRLKLPDSVTDRLGIVKGSQMALIERDDGLALKILTVIEEPGSWAQAVEQETVLRLERRIITNPEEDKLLSILAEQSARLRVKIDPMNFLQGRTGFHAWFARRILGVDDASDVAPQRHLIQERLDSQLGDGSWEGDLLSTAQALKELYLLGLPATDEVIRRGAEWLLERPQSEFNPGMFFLNDNLVAQQATILKGRKDGGKGRFRQVKTSEITRVSNSIPTAHFPCGPRIMWPNALVLEVLILLGYEDHPRLQADLMMLGYSNWCECHYAHGIPDRLQRLPLTTQEIEMFEIDCRAQFHFGGLPNIQSLEYLDGHELPRVASQEIPDRTIYILRLPEHLLPCELITSLGLCHVESPLLQRLATAHLWRFAGRQHPPLGNFSGGGGKHVTPYFYLDLFSRFDHPAARISLLRMLPWVIADQNPDGSWGQGMVQEAATLAVARMLAVLRSCIPGLYCKDDHVGAGKN